MMIDDYDMINNVPSSIKFAYKINYGFIICKFNCLIAILIYSYRVS